MQRSGNNLPAPITSFVGRAQEIETCGALLAGAPERTRLLTLSGPGGVGKTRLALEVAAVLGRNDAFADGVWLVELAALNDPARLPQVVASVFGLQEERGRTFSDLLLDALSGRNLLLVLDNCEHLVHGAAGLAHAVLSACPSVRILATSREPLGITGEVTRVVPPLTVPDRHTVEQLRTNDAVRLFVERAVAASADFRLAERNAPAVAQICIRLGGVPLALELAAARVRALSVEQIAERLDDRFRVLGEGNRTGPARQQTLEAAVAWSYDLLEASEQRLFERLSVFAGGWTLEDAEAISDEPSSVLDLLVRLVEKSLVMAGDGPGDHTWYRLLDTIREFGARRLRSSGHQQAVRERHFGWYVRLAEAADQTIRWTSRVGWPAKQAWLSRLGWEYPNLRAAWEWAMQGDPDHVQDGLRLAEGLFTFFWTTGYLSEGRDWLGALLVRDADQAPTDARAWALSAAAKLAAHHGDNTAAHILAQAYLALPRLLQQPPASALVHTALGLGALHANDLRAARAHASRALELSRSVGEFSAPLYPTYLAAVAAAERRFDEARQLYEEALAEGRAADFPLPVGMALDGLARLARAQGDPRQARALWEEGLDLLRAIGGMPQTAALLVTLGQLALDDGDLVQARLRFAEGLEVAAALGHREWLVGALEGIASLSDAGESAVRLFGATAALRHAEHLPPAGEQVRRALARLRPRFNRHDLDALLAEGRRLSLEEAIALARRLLSGAAPAPTLASTLTQREREVAALLVRGCSNGEIAEALVIGKRTVEMHVGQVLAKLNVRSRAQVVTLAAEQGWFESPARRLH
jgi:predicted ATPase/DNA-binding CsgD family transcriptional regulator